MAVDPAKLIVALIEQAPSLVDGEGNYPTNGPYTGWRLFRNVMPDTMTDKTIPDTCVVVYNSPGGRPNPRFLLDFPAIQVRVRSSKSDFDAAYNKANEVKSRLLGIFATTVLGDQIMSITMAVDLMSMGMDAEKRINYAMTFNLIVQPAASSGDNRIPLN